MFKMDTKGQVHNAVMEVVTIQQHNAGRFPHVYSTQLPKVEAVNKNMLLAGCLLKKG